MRASGQHLEKPTSQFWQPRALVPIDKSLLLRHVILVPMTQNFYRYHLTHPQNIKCFSRLLTFSSQTCLHAHAQLPQPEEKKKRALAIKKVLIN